MALSNEEIIKIDELTTQALESEDSEKRRVAAESQLVHRLRNCFQGIDDKVEIDLTFVTCAEYQLFLDDMKEQNKFYQPDHWNTCKFPSGKSLEPVSGVRPEDAQAFCKWLAQYEDNGNRYRLPTIDEVKKFPSKEVMGVWCREPGEFKLSGIEGSYLNLIFGNLRSVLNESNPSLLVMNLNPDIEFEGFNFLNFFRDYLMYPLIIITLILYLYFSLAVFSISFPVFIILSLIIYILLYFITDGSIIDISTSLIATILKIVVLAPFLWIVLSFFCNCLPLTIILFVILGSNATDWIGIVISEVSTAFDKLGFYIAENIHAGIGKFSRLFRPRKNDPEIPDSVADKDSLTNRQLSSNFDEKIKQQKSALLFYEHYHKKSKPNWLKQNKTNESNLDIKTRRWLQVTIARKEGNLPTWEGIRLVREKS